jgi:hypothetical protein
VTFRCRRINKEAMGSALDIAKARERFHGKLIKDKSLKKEVEEITFVQCQGLDLLKGFLF